MPIKPENKARYPDNWKEVRKEILARAGSACEKCGAPNRALIARGAGKDEGTYMMLDGAVHCAETGKKLGVAKGSEYERSKVIEVVLTIAHLDHQPENCDPENLRAWCQRCHLRYDKEHHAESARATRKSRLAMADLFDGPYR